MVDPAVLVATVTADDAVVATVDGRPIHASDVKLQAESADTDARTALAALVDAEVLAGQALRDGFYTSFDVVEARREQEARRFIVTRFEPETAAVPDQAMRRVYDREKLFFDHPEFVEVWNLVALSGKAAPPADKAKAHAQIVELVARAQDCATDADFQALASSAPGEIPVKAEELTFPRVGVVEDSFAAAAFLLTKPGQTSPPVETSYGWHLIRLVRHEAERHTSFEAAKPELRASALVEYRQSKLASLTQDLMEKHGVVVHPERLEKQAP
ncbi:MAG: peptidylprolyl isomerase [Polyangia bacterium]